MSIAMLVGRIAYIVQVQSFATNVARSVFSCMRDQTYVGVGNYILYWRDLANTTERSIRGGSAAFCQTVSTNDYSVAFLKKTLLCIVVVSGLNNFQVGFLSDLPGEGWIIDPNSYVVCGSASIPVDVAGLVIDVVCTASTQQYRYVIVQSLDASAEKLCIAEACVNTASQYRIYLAVMPHVVVLKVCLSFAFI